MKFKYIFLPLVMLFITLSFQQKEKLKTYDGNFFKINYPEGWIAAKEGEIVNIFPQSQVGAITISGYEGLKLDDEQTRKMILDVNQSTEDADKITKKNRSGYMEYNYEFLDPKENIFWITKLLKKNDEIHLITVNCEQKYWNGNYRTQFLEALATYKPKNRKK